MAKQIDKFNKFTFLNFAIGGYIICKTLRAVPNLNVAIHAISIDEATVTDNKKCVQLIFSQSVKTGSSLKKYAKITNVNFRFILTRK